LLVIAARTLRFGITKPFRISHVSSIDGMG
jgi:hypothetical protein